MEYPKTENLYARDPETHKVGPENGFRQPECALIGSWLVLDKLDGMNMRVIWDFEQEQSGGAETSAIRVLGRTDRANIPGDLMSSIREWATYEAFMATFSWYKELEDGTTGHFRPDEVILFGEGIGPGIQGEAGQAYGGEKRFVLFDVVVDGKWLCWDDVVGIAAKLGIGHADVLARDVDLEEAKLAAVHRFGGTRRLGDTTFGPDGRPFIEGGILRTDPYVFDWRGNRVMAKYKVRDL